MRSFLWTTGLVSAAILLASCAGYQPLGTTFIRADGQAASPDQLAADRSACSDAGDKLENCMSGKGYALVPDDQVDEKQKEFAEAAEKKKQEQAALIAAEKKKHAASRKAAAKKKLKTKNAVPATAGIQSVSGTAQAAPTNAAPATTNAQSSPWPQQSGNLQPAPSRNDK